MKDWNYIRRIKRRANFLLLLNIVLVAILFLAPSSKSSSDESSSLSATINAKRGVKLRVEPNVSSKDIVTIPPDARVSILSTDTVLTNKWVRVKFNKTIGWVWGDYIKIKNKE
ncbi:SH3 domain-containing protein [Desertivirga brevis]|uniref:SH3 domain-containing protein n=1 Tax=Desertivirga brevis TaxID=2810310 RepID=UPI001A96416A|nr:SH3 domain-containing protein [Pedobacter sp. SYSU D00873]